MSTDRDRQNEICRRIGARLEADPVGRGTQALQSAYGRPMSKVVGDAARGFLSARRSVAIVTGFCITDAAVPAAETDGPPGAVYLARTLLDLGHEVTLISDDFGVPLLEAGCDAAGIPRSVVQCLPFEGGGLDSPARNSNAAGCQPRTDAWVAAFLGSPLGGRLTHLIALERAGPSHTLESALAGSDDLDLAAEFTRLTSPEGRNLCHNMRGTPINAFTAKSHRLFEMAAQRRPAITTIGMADGGNEIGFGSIAWTDIRAAIAGGNGSRIACRIAVDHLLIGGISDWAAFALGVAIRSMVDRDPPDVQAEVQFQRQVLESIVSETTAVDGITRAREATVDGLSLELYLEGLKQFWLAAS